MMSNQVDESKTEITVGKLVYTAMKIFWAKEDSALCLREN